MHPPLSRSGHGDGCYFASSSHSRRGKQASPGHLPRHTLFTMPAKDLAFVLRVRPNSHDPFALYSETEYFSVPAIWYWAGTGILREWRAPPQRCSWGHEERQALVARHGSHSCRGRLAVFPRCWPPSSPVFCEIPLTPERILLYCCEHI
jgi:hypothetical protein